MDDKLASRLREDAAGIEVRVSDELDDRIRASLEAVAPDHPAPSSPRRAPARLWWASSLTGAAVALVLIVLVNLDRPTPPEPVETVVAEPLTPRLTVKSAVLTAPLEKELENLEADFRKAEEAVRKDIDFFP